MTFYGPYPNGRDLNGGDPHLRARRLLYFRAFGQFRRTQRILGNRHGEICNCKIKLVSTADTGFYYTTKKNPRNITEKMTFRKYDPVVRKHVEFKEAKIK